MSLTSVYFCNSTVRVALGTPGDRHVRLARLLTLSLQEGCLINGVITNETALEGQLSAFWRENSLPTKNVALIIDSTQFLSKMVRVPMLSSGKMLEIAKNELAPMETRQDPIVDYMLLQRDKAARTETILAASVERSFLEQYVNLFERMGVALCKIDTALACQLKLVDFMPVFRGKTCVLLAFDGDTLQAMLVENGQYKYSSRSRLFSEHGTPELGGEVTRLLSSTLQFQASDKSGYAITDAYFCGCTQQDFDACAEGCGMLNLTASLLPDDANISLPTGARLCDCAGVAGNYIIR